MKLTSVVPLHLYSVPLYLTTESPGQLQQNLGISAVLHLREGGRVGGGREICGLSIKPLSVAASCQVPSACLSGLTHISEDLTRLSLPTLTETLAQLHCS